MLQLLPEGTLHHQVSSKAKTLVLVLATSTQMTETKGEALETMKTVKAVKTTGAAKNGKESEGKYPKNLARIPCIQYSITFRKKFVPMTALLDSGSKVNAIHSIFVKKLGLPIRPTDIEA